MNFYRPRGTLARAIYEKFHNDNYLDEYDTRLWYCLSQNLPDEFLSKFVPLSKPDAITIRWMERAKLLSANIWMHLWHAVARSFLQFFMTQTDINGYLKRGSMFILSEHQFSMILRAGGFDERAHDTINILDIGAGDGEISLRMLNALQGNCNGSNANCAGDNTCLQNNTKVRVFATETSWTMRERLKKLNFNVIENINEIKNVQLISCLNVLDRCIDPIELLQDIYEALAPEGRVIIALVLPYVHYCEFNTSHLPIRPLMGHWPARAKQFSFEAEATMFFELLESWGFKVESWTKAPYLCEGDLRQSFYWLIDLVVVLSKKPVVNT